MGVGTQEFSENSQFQARFGHKYRFKPRHPHVKFFKNGVYSSLFRAQASGGHSKARETRDAQIDSICTDRSRPGPAAGVRVSPTSDTCQSIAILMNRRHCAIEDCASVCSFMLGMVGYTLKCKLLFDVFQSTIVFVNVKVQFF